MKPLALLALLTLLAPQTARSAEGVACERTQAFGTRYTICTVDLDKANLRLFLNRPDGRPLGSFRALSEMLEAQGESLSLAMNAGMYHPDMSPVGLHVEEGREMKPLSTARGPGNFHMKPNGVFYIAGNAAGVMESERFARERPKVDYASQSGPMLVIDGKLHPRFLADSDSRKRRNGVCVKDGRRVHLAISEGPVNFHGFARLFRDELGCDNALYLDGTISSLHAPQIGRQDGFFPVGPMLGVVAPKP